MFNSIYSSSSALQASERAHAVIAQNLAHINVPGYRRQLNIFESMLNRDPNVPAAGAGRELNGVTQYDATDFEQGAFRNTERSLDLALSGDAFFTVEGPEGPLYTRNGSFRINPAGQLESAAGLLVSGEGGPIQVPDNISENQIKVTEDGSISVGQTQIGRLEITSFADNSALTRAGTTLFRADPQAEQQAQSFKVVQGALESANTSPVSELIQMIVGSRHFEASQKAMRTISDAIQLNTSPRG